MAYQLNFHNNGFYLTHQGQIAIDEINEVNGKIQGDARFDHHKFQIINLLEADFSEVNPKMSRIVGATDYAASKSRHSVRVAIVAADDDALTFCREYIGTAAKLGSNWFFQIFDNAQEAEKWALEDG